MFWFYFSLIAVILYASVNIIDKNLISDIFKRPNTQMIISGIIQIFIGTIGVLVWGFESASLLVIIFAMLGGVGAFFGGWFYFLALSKEEVSRTIPLLNLIPIWVLIFATIFLGEVLTQIQYFGILILVIGAALISIKKGTKYTLTLGVPVMVISTLFYGGQYIFWGLATTEISFWTVFFFSALGHGVCNLILFIIKKDEIITNLKKFKKHSAISGFGEILSAFGDLLLILAFSIGLISLTSAVTAIQPLILLVFAIALSVLWPKILKEELKGSVLALKIIAIILIVAGSIMIL
ncbi:MAG: DMT family transporter [Candidatus Diapherotrites archaeon]|nr:DMT family transporter [Candidatus Diapherotrites archaeon]